MLPYFTYLIFVVTYRNHSFIIQDPRTKKMKNESKPDIGFKQLIDPNKRKFKNPFNHIQSKKSEH